MRLPALVVVVILVCSDAAAGHQDPDCEDCHENGSWFPLFQPSQIISSEFPEHEQYHSQEAPPPLTYATARPQVSQESQSHECDDPQVSSQAVDLGSREAPGVDSPVKTYNRNGQHRVEWDHYGDITTVATVVYNGLEDRGSGVGGEDRSDASRDLGPGDKRGNALGRDTSSSVRSQEESFFDNGSFFDENQSPSDSLSEDFEVSNNYPYSYSREQHHHGNSIEEFNSYEKFGARKPVATSYSSISSVFESRPVSRARDLLHPSLAYNDIPHYIDLPRLRANKSRPYMVREGMGAGSAIPRNNQPLRDAGPIGVRPSSYVPLDHPVYRYVKAHGGMTHRKPTQSRATVHWEDIHPLLRSRFPFKYLRPRVMVQNQENFINHVVPTKDPFSDSDWRESQKIEDLKPPPLGQTLYYLKKKPSPTEMSIARRRQGPGLMYIIKRNKRFH